MQLFLMSPHSVLIEIDIVRNYVINNFKLHDQLSRIQSILLQESLQLTKPSHFAEKIVFRSTLEAPSEKTVHIQELVMSVKVVYNIVSNNFYFD